MLMALPPDYLPKAIAGMAVSYPGRAG
jgi:hypothetical protein